MSQFSSLASRLADLIFERCTHAAAPAPLTISDHTLASKRVLRVHAHALNASALALLAGVPRVLTDWPLPLDLQPESEHVPLKMRPYMRYLSNHARINISIRAAM